MILIYAGFVSLGLPDGTFGVAWPELYPRLNLPIWLAGAVVTVGTILTTIAGFTSGWVIARWRTGPVVLVSCLLTGSGLVLLGFAQGGIWLFAAAIPMGLGAGAVDAGLNGYVARHYSGRHMSWLHACWGVGATSGPVLMGLAISAGLGWRAGYWLLGGIQLSLAVVFLVSLRLWAAVPERSFADHPSVAGGAKPTMQANTFAGWLGPAVFALYVAVEATVAVWAGTILVMERGFDAKIAATCTAVLFGALTVGRIASGFMVDRWGNRRLVRLGLSLALLGLVLFGLTHGAWLAGIALAVTGLGLAPIYPCLMHEVPRRFAPEAAQTVIGRQSGAASLGAATVPALAGWVADHSLSAVPWLAVGCLLLAMAGVGKLNRLT